MSDYSKEIDAALDAIAKVDPRLVGDEFLARQLILALCDQGMLPIKLTNKIADILGTDHLENRPGPRSRYR